MKRRTINKQYHRRHPTRRANGVYALCGRTVEEFMRGGNIGHDKQTYSANRTVTRYLSRFKKQQNGGNEDVEN